jgi:hypothetical protein
MTGPDPVPSRKEAVTQSLSGGLYDVEVVPESGARVTSLAHGDHGEWLADSGRGWPAQHPAAWSDGDNRGWDECLPNVAPGRHPELDAELADHGEIWNRAWEAEIDAGRLVTRVRGRLLPFEFERNLAVDRDGVSASYRLENVASMPYSVAWAMHLLLDATPRDLRLSAEVPVRVDSVFGLDASFLHEGWIAWGDLTERLPMDDLGWAAKVFTRPGSVDAMTVDDGRGTITVSISENTVPATFGLWLNAAGWPSESPLAHLGLEPGFGDHDELDAAMTSGSTLNVEPGEPSYWKVSMVATSATRSTNDTRESRS